MLSSRKTAGGSSPHVETLHSVELPPLSLFSQSALQAESATDLSNAFQSYLEALAPESHFEIVDGLGVSIIGSKVRHENNVVGVLESALRVEIPLRIENKLEGRLLIFGPNLSELEVHQSNFLVAADVLILALDRMELRQSKAKQEQRLQIALDAAGMGVWAYRVDSEHLEWDSRQYDVLGLSRDEELSDWKNFASRIPQEDRENLKKAVELALHERSALSIQFRFRGADNQERWIGARGACLVDDNGPFLIGVNFDVTQRHHSEERLRALMGELNHRVKNILASISAIARQSMKEGDCLEDYVSHLRGRIRAFASVHEMLSRTNWDGVVLADLVNEIIQAASNTEQVSINGPAVLLRGRAGQMLALALHELATNSAKFGALSGERGHLSVHWTCPSGQDGAVFVEWVETGVSLASKDISPGFGSFVIQELLPQDLDAQVQFGLGDTEVRCSIALPSEWIVGH